ncbi:ABC transporter permease [Ferrimonas balearica]|nr:ABC transporter permease [Ferrimonas balearica]
MLAFLVKRTVAAIIMLMVVATVVFGMLQLIPGDPAELLLTSGGRRASEEAIAALRETMGLNRSVLEQYVTFMTGIFRLDLGHSIIDGSPVAESILRRLPRSLELILAASILATAAAIPMGTLAAMKPNGTADRILSGLAAFMASLPVFVVGPILIYIVAQRLSLLPAGGFVAFAQAPGQHLAMLMMPAFTISLQLYAMLFRMARSTVLDTRHQDWVRTARAKGLHRRPVLRRHILRNAVPPVITILGIQMGILLGSTVLVESVFNWPGLSGFLISAVEQRDYTAVQGVIIVTAAIFIGINLVIEVINSLIDPRLRLK